MPTKKQMEGKERKKIILSPAGINQAMQLALEGNNLTAIASMLNINITTLLRWRKENNDFSIAIKEGMELAQNRMENALFQNGLNGNTTAQMFWLSHMDRKKWGDIKEEQQPEETPCELVVMPVGTESNRYEDIKKDLVNGNK